MKNLFICCFLSLLSCLAAIEKVSFNQDVRPILADRCFHCHGPDEESREKKLRLDVVNERDGAYRIRKGKAAIKPGNLNESEVWKRLITEDEDDIMPPLDSHKKPLTPKEKAIIKQWIEEGAEYEDFWAFTKLKKPAIPKVKDLTWSEGAIDRFVLKSFEAKSLKPSSEADKRTLIRRVTFDLTGLPPTLMEITQFLKDKSSDAYESLINRLLSKSQYGEHMAKYWLDLVRFADSNGLHNDRFRNFYSYREWIIKAFNKNLKYDDFVKYQLAGDLYEKPTQDQLVASAFNRLHLIINAGTALPEESYTKNVIDRVTAVGTVFMGLTMECAMCHDHKYDPITQKDFYSLFAFFNNLDGGPETVKTSSINGLQKPLIRFSTAKEKELIRDFDLQITKLRKELTGLVTKKKKEKDQKKQKS